MRTIFHVTTLADWQRAEPTGEYRLSTRGRTLEDEGFIHCSDAQQVDRIARALYGGSADPLVLLEIDADAVDAEIRYENLDGGAELFPHVYGPIPTSAVVSATSFEPPSADAMSGWPVPDRTDPAQVSGEREALEAWLDYHRATLLTKCAGLGREKLADRSCPPSNLSLLGLVRHLTEVEAWFHDFDGEPEGDWYSTDKEPDACFATVDPSRADNDLAAYHASVDRSRAAVTGRDLDEISPVRDQGRDVSLRWIYLHMIEEYARHNGHADLLRERIDGMTGE